MKAPTPKIVMHGSPRYGRCGLFLIAISEQGDALTVRGCQRCDDPERTYRIKLTPAQVNA